MKVKEGKSEFKKVEKCLYHIPTRNKKPDKIEVNTLLKKDLSPVTHINESGPQQDFVSFNKPALHEASMDKETKADLDKLLDSTKDAFVEDKRQIGTTPLIEITIDTWEPPTYNKGTLHHCLEAL